MHLSSIRFPFIIALLVLAIVATACSSSSGDASAGDTGELDNAAERAAESESDGGSGDDEAQPTTDDDGTYIAPEPDFDYSTVDYDAEPASLALRNGPIHPSFPPPIVAPSDVVSGGPPPDGIPPIDAPVFIGVDEVNFITNPDEPVVVVDINGDARAYPIQIMIWHEIVNDEVGGVPVTVTYCPLCNSAIAYDRRFGDRVLDFGTSGSLYQSAMVMYDRETESLWAHFTGQGIIGHYAGAELTLVPVQTLSFGQFAELHPDGQVLSLDTGFERSYGVNPYAGYDDENSAPIGGFISQPIDERLQSKIRVVGVVDPAGPIAVPLTAVSESGVFSYADEGRNLVVFHQGGLVSALDQGEIAAGQEIGQTGAFVPTAEDGTALTFQATTDGFVDDQTGTTWSINGLAVEGALAGESLERLPHVDTFWFAWATYRPTTLLIE